MKNEKRSFKERYSNDWICTLKQVEELKNALLSKTIEEIRFCEDGTWDKEEKNVKGDPLFILIKNNLHFVTQNDIDDLLFNICDLIFGLKHSLFDKKLPLKSNALRNDLFHSYNFVFNYLNYEFKCIIKWKSSNSNLLIKIGNKIIGYFEDIRQLINYFLDLSKIELPFDFYFPKFWKEIKKFEDYYFTLVNETNFSSIRPTKEIILQNRYPWESHGTYSKISDFINRYSLDIPIPKNVDVKKYINTQDIFFWHERIYGYENKDLEALAELTLIHIENNPLEPFEIRKEKCTYTNGSKIILDKEYSIEWNHSERCFKVNSLNDDCKYFDNPKSLIAYILSVIPDAIDKEIKNNYYTKIEKFAYQIFKDSNDTSEYKDLVDFISNYVQWKLRSNDLPF
ncbi:hypothetical protein [Bacillus sp. PS06]|uniref:hypothetical protein n=1 Tax=Bacillus sp. PS06 TaxID=2764176 RepID=UPI00178729D4|nr:hypothetical protein [Bacillus sp. PS06]MBD8069911.1 hypothetical protein [Bacillus sp. PS06]